MDTITRGADLPVLALLRSRVEESRYQTSGTTIVRPSTKSTDRVSSVKLTFFTRSPGLISEPCIPFLHQIVFVFPEHLLYAPKFHRAESQIKSQANRLQPEFRGLVVAIHVNMRRLVWLMTEKVYPVRT